MRGGGWLALALSHTLGEQGPCLSLIRKRAPRLAFQLQSARAAPGRELDDSSCRLSRTPSSYKASFCTIFCRAGLMTICGGRDDAEPPRSGSAVERAPS